MAWTRIDDNFLMNPKVQTAGPLGMALYLAGLIYANTNLTDGFIVERMLPVLCGMAYQTPNKGTAQVLVKLNLWEKVNGGYQIHDFLVFNKSREQIRLLNKQRAENGAKNNPAGEQIDTGTGTGPGTGTGTGPGTRAGTGTGTGTGDKSVPINPNTLIPLKELTTTERAKNVFAVYEDIFGGLNEHAADLVKAAVAETSDEWVIEAMREAVRQSVKKWSYVEKVLQGWKKNGFKVDTRPKASEKPRNGGGANKSNRRTPDLTGYEISRANEEVFVEDGYEPKSV